MVEGAIKQKHKKTQSDLRRGRQELSLQREKNRNIENITSQILGLIKRLVGASVICYLCKYIIDKAIELAKDHPWLSVGIIVALAFLVAAIGAAIRGKSQRTVKGLLKGIMSYGSNEKEE